MRPPKIPFPLKRCLLRMNTGEICDPKKSNHMLLAMLPSNVIVEYGANARALRLRDEKLVVSFVQNKENYRGKEYFQKGRIGDKGLKGRASKITRDGKGINKMYGLET